jgi:glutaredoxin 3
MIKVYSTPTCPYCVTLKNFLKEHDIQFEDIDVSQNEIAAKEMIDKSGQMGVPVIDIDGEMIVGFDQERIKKLLKIN